MTIKEAAFNNKQYAVLRQVHIGILGTGLLLGNVKMWHRVTCSTLSEYLFFVRVCMQIGYK